MARWRWWRVILRNWRTEKYTPGDALTPIGEKKTQLAFVFTFQELATYWSIGKAIDTTASFEKIILFIKELDLIDENHHRLNLFRIAPTYGYSLCFQTAMSCIFLSFSLGNVCKKAIIQLEIFSNSKLSNLLTRNKSRIFEMSNQY